MVLGQMLAGLRLKKCQCFKLKAIRQEEFSLISLLVLFRPLADWKRLIHIGRAVYFTMSADSNVNLLQKHPHTHSE